MRNFVAVEAGNGHCGSESSLQIDGCSVCCCVAVSFKLRESFDVFLARTGLLVWPIDTGLYSTQDHRTPIELTSSCCGVVLFGYRHNRNT